ncbi:hypothetical protein SESBI_16476 [Sesbania bispinosa]|nr:hypothetical protein SESBI_16476 [Sesbania bispinosa]
MNYGRNGSNVVGSLGNKGSGRMTLSKDGDRSIASDNSRLRRKGNGRRFVSKAVDGSNEMYSGKDFDRQQRGSNSIAGRRGGIYTRRTSDYSPRVRDVNSEVYDMGLQQDGLMGSNIRASNLTLQIGGPWSSPGIWSHGGSLVYQKI